VSRPRVKIVGLPRSGTRYISMLVANNYCVDVDKTGKHFTPTAWGHHPYDVALAISKRFDRWLTSTIRAGYTYDITKKRMYRQLNRSYGPHTLPGLFQCAYDVYTKFYTEWAAQPNVVSVSYEELLRSPREMLDTLADKHGWSRNPAQEWDGHGPDKMPDWRVSYYLE
jgi:hypothetical protein